MSCSYVKSFRYYMFCDLWISIVLDWRFISLGYLVFKYINHYWLLCFVALCHFSWQFSLLPPHCVCLYALTQHGCTKNTKYFLIDHPAVVYLWPHMLVRSKILAFAQNANQNVSRESYSASRNSLVVPELRQIIYK